MPSEYDNIRNRHKQGEDAKKRVLSRVYGGTEQKETPKVSQYDAIRNRKADYITGSRNAPVTVSTYEARQNVNEQRMKQSEPSTKPVLDATTVAQINAERPKLGEAVKTFQQEHPLYTPPAKGFVDKLAKVEQKVAKTLGLPMSDEKEFPSYYEQQQQKELHLNPAEKFVGGLANTALFGVPSHLERAVYGPLAEEGRDSLPYRVGEFAGYTVAPGAKTAEQIGAKLIPQTGRLANIGRNAVTGAIMGGANQAAQEGVDIGFGGGLNAKDRLTRIGEATAFGGALGGAVGGLTEGVSKYAKIRNARKGITAAEQSTVTPKPEAAPQETVAPVEKAKDSWFNRLFGSSNLGIKAGSKTTRTGTGVQIVNNPLKKDAQGVIDETKALGRAVKQDYIDSTAPLKHLGGDVQDVALDARRANNLANTWVHDKAVTPEGTVIGNSLKDVIGAVPRGQGNAFEDYLIVRHAKTRVARGEKVYEDRLEMNDVKKLEARQAELEQRYPEFKRLGEEWDNYNSRLLDTGENFGLISEAQKTAMREQNPNYASMRRQFSNSEKYTSAIGAKQGFSGQKAPIKEVSPTGSARKIVSPIRSAIEQTGAWMQAGMRNRVMQTILQRVESDPEAMKGIVEVVPDHLHQKNLKEINEVLEKDGVEGLAELLNDEYNAMFVKGKPGKTDNIVTVMVDGNPVKMRVLNPEVFKALQGLTPQEMGIVMGTFRMLSNATKHGATGFLAPLFAAKGLTTDVAQALIQSKNPWKHAGDLIHATFSSIADKLPKGTPGVKALRALAQDYRRAGGEYSAALRGDRALNRSVGQLKREPLLSPKGIGKGAVTALKTPFKLLEGVSDVAENVNRMAAYKGELRRGGNVRTSENVRRAMRESQEITTNFSRKGAKSEAVEAFVPYSNAAVQGIRRFGKQWAKHPIRTSIAVTAGIVLPKVWESATFGNDPDYQQLPARTRYRNIIVGKNADGTFIQLPMPPEYEAIGAMIGDVFSKFKDNNPIEWGAASDAIVNAYTPPFVSGAAQGATQGGGVDQSVVGALNSTVIGPISGYAHNQSWTGAPIVPQRLQANSPYMQKDERTSQLSSWIAKTDIGKKLELSPIKLDYLFKQYGGDIARLGLPVITDMGSGTKTETLLRNFIVDPTFTNNLSRDFYNRIDKVTQNAADVGDGATAPAWLTDEVKKIATSRAKGSPLKTLTELSAEKRDIQGNKLLSAREKSLKLRDNQQKINNIYLDVVSRLEKLGVPK